MSILRLNSFSGEIPKLLARQLPPSAAQVAVNVRLDDGGLTPVRQSEFVATLPGAPVNGFKSFFRFEDEWLAWDTVVHAARGPVAQSRLYYTGDGVPKMRVGADVYNLAVPRPTAVLSGVASGTGTAPTFTRVYVYTFVTDYGEESEPNPASADINWQAGQTVTLSGFQAAPTGRAITKQRIYRSQTSESGVTSFFFIAERTAAATDYVDSIGLDAIGDPLPSALFHTPPDTLEGLIALPNGMMAAFVGKDLYFSEPYQPHAWPENYVLTTDYSIVGLGAFGNSIVIMTEGIPYIATGTAPENMVMERIEQNLPCINARGIVDLGYSVAYPSHDGLVVVSTGGADVVTKSLYSRTEWLLLNPQTMKAGQYSGRYYASYLYTDADAVEHSGTIIIDLRGQQPFIIRSHFFGDAMFYELDSGSLYYLENGDTVYEYDATGAAPELLTWRSPKYMLPAPANIGVILIESEAVMDAKEQSNRTAGRQVVIDANAAMILAETVGGELNSWALNELEVNGDNLTTPPSLGGSLTVNVYADNRLVRTVGTIGRIARMPGGFMAKMWEVEVVTDFQVSQIVLASSPAELKGMSG